MEEKVRALKAEGYGAQKWFLAHGPAEGRPGLLKNVDLVRRTREAAGDDVAPGRGTPTIRWPSHQGML